VNYHSYGQEQQTQKMKVRFQNSYLPFFKNMWELTKYYDFIVMMNAIIYGLWHDREEQAMYYHRVDQAT
jgi:hypothetical protein